MQRGGKRLRVNVQLIEAETGNHLWAERVDHLRSFARPRAKRMRLAVSQRQPWRHAE